jgi:hypothetical protein
VVRNIFLAIVFAMPLTHAATIMYTSTPKSNPAYVTASLAVSCEKAVEFFEKNAGKILGDIPFIADARVMGKADWKETDKGDYYTNYTKSMNLGVTPALTKEFPTVFMPATMKKQFCLPPKENGLSCQTNYSITFSGAEATVYEKVIEASKSQDWMKSFNGSMTFQSTGSSSCTFTNNFNISDNTYLWVKRKLIKDINPILIEERILTRFVEWAKLILPTVEGK